MDSHSTSVAPRVVDLSSMIATSPVGALGLAKRLGRLNAYGEGGRRERQSDAAYDDHRTHRGYQTYGDDGHRHRAEVRREETPHDPSGDDAQRYADHETNGNHGQRLPARRHQHLASNKSEHFQKRHLTPSTCHADEEKVRERRGAEQGERDAE